MHKETNRRNRATIIFIIYKINLQSCKNRYKNNNILTLKSPEYKPKNRPKFKISFLKSICFADRGEANIFLKFNTNFRVIWIPKPTLNIFPVP